MNKITFLPKVKSVVYFHDLKFKNQLLFQNKLFF